MHASPALKLEDIRLNLSNQAGEVNILKGINLEINQGETVAIVGPSGSGKSSLLMVLAGLERQTSGQLSIIGQNVSQYNEDQFAKFRGEHIGIVFQDFHLIPTMSALENVAIPLEFSNHPSPFEEAKKHLVSVGLGERLEHFPSQLSGGEQQRVALARAFATNPNILLADEPTGNLDGATGEKVMDLLFERHNELKNTLLLITHDPKLAQRCARTIHVQDGRILNDSLNMVAAS